MSCALLSAGYTGFLAHSNEEAGAGSMAAKLGQLQLRPCFDVTSDLMNDNFSVTLSIKNVFGEQTQPCARTHAHTHGQKPFVIWKTDFLHRP